MSPKIDNPIDYHNQIIPVLRDLGSVINGKTVISSKTNKFYFTINPATLKTVHEWPDMGEEEAIEAVEAANIAFKTTWGPRSKLTPRNRSDALLKIYDIVLKHKEEFAKLISIEGGKPLNEARGEVVYAASFLKWFSEEAVRTYGMTIPSLVPGRQYLTFKEPVGVCSMITPWNFPIAMITRKVAPAIATGCTVVIKPAPETPAAAVYFAKLIADNNILPPGVVNVITCSKGESSAISGKVLSTHPLVKKISFTGSTAVGKILLSQASQTIKRASMELGGNAPFIVFEDADIDEAVKGCLNAKFRNAGQTCVCPNRIIVHKDVIDEFGKKLAKEVSKFKIGDTLDDENDVGPLISETGLNKTEEHIKDAISKGGKLLIGGKRAEFKDPKLSKELKGYYYEPTVVTNLPRSAIIQFEETFGPFAGLIPFETEEEALDIANDTVHGLASYFFTKSYSRILRFSRAIESGMVGINSGLISAENIPFGGIKESGTGREGGSTGIDEYLNLKYVAIGIHD